jgi:hypothetical protein
MTRSHAHQGLGLDADASRYLRALKRRSLGPLGLVAFHDTKPLSHCLDLSLIPSSQQ